MEEAERLDVAVVLDAKVIKVDSDAGTATLENGKVVAADVIVGGDGTFMAIPEAFLVFSWRNALLFKSTDIL